MVDYTNCMHGLIQKGGSIEPPEPPLATGLNTAICIAFAWINVLPLKVDVISELIRLHFMVCQTVLLL